MKVASARSGLPKQTMKILSLLLSPALTLGVCNGPALAQQTPAALPVVPDPLKRSVTLPPQGASLDDDLIALGRAAKINLIADASQWAEGAPALGEPRTGLPSALLGRDGPTSLSWLAQGDTLLVWTRPDTLVLARRIAGGESIRRVALPPAPSAPALNFAVPAPGQPLDIKALIDAARAAQNSQEELWQTRWNEYLSELADGQARGPGWTRDIALSDLPPDLHAYALVRAQEYLLPSVQMAHWKAWMTEEFWQTARLSIRNIDTMTAGAKVTDPPQKKAISMLVLSNTLQVTPGQRGNTMMSIANLGEAPATVAQNAPVITQR